MPLHGGGRVTTGGRGGNPPQFWAIADEPARQRAPTAMAKVRADWTSGMVFEPPSDGYPTD